MKISYSYFKRTCLFLALFSWLLPMNLSSQIAIGTGTVTLNYTNTSNPAAPAGNTYINSKLDNEVCITFGQYNSSTLTYSGTFVYNSGDIRWEVNITPGIYDIDVTYGTGAWGTRPFFELYNGETKIADIFQAPSGKTSGANPGVLGLTGTNTVDLSTLDGNTTYTLKVIDGWGGAYGTCIGHISFTPKAGVNMAAFGQSADGGPTTLPNNGSNTINGITVTTNMELDLCNGRTYDYLFGNEGTDYVDISVGSDQIMTGLATSVFYDGYCTGGLYIQFCSSATYDAGSLVGSPILLDGLAYADFYTYPPATASVTLPGSVIKSARIYRNGNCEFGTRLYRIEVEAEADECTSPLTASFAAGTGATGDIPANILACEGQSFSLPNPTALSKLFSAFAGWNDGSNTYAAGYSYTMPAGGVSFTAQWVEDATTIRIPTVTVLNYDNQSTSVPTTDYWDVTDDGNNDVCLDMRNQTAEWNVFITPGIYDISTICAVPSWGIGYSLSIIDPQTDSQVMELFTEHTNGAYGVPIIRNLTNTFDLSSLVDGKRYIIRIQDTWTNCGLLAHDIIFSPQTPSLTTHTRNLPVGEYGTICLPYEVQAANIAGADVFELAGWPAESNAVTLNQIAGNMAAGHPYIFQATAATSTFSYEESGYQDAQSVNGLIGSYSQETITPNDNNYIIYNNQLYLVDVLAYVGANRAYINRTAAESAVASPAPGRRQIKLYVAGTEVATGLEQINGTCPDGKFIQNGQLFIRRDGRTYNAQGIEIK